MIVNTKKKIIVENITKVYNIYRTPKDRLFEAFLPRKSRHTEFFALKGVSFDVTEGEIIGIMGRNGAGKSTLLKIITGVLQPTSGNVTVSGRISSLLELGAGFNNEYTGLENIYFYGTIMGLTKQEISAKVQEIIDFAEIGEYIHQPVKTYSSGMFARLAFSCAINVEPEILIVDEILSVGDLRFQSKCFKKFKEFKQKGVTILYVGHDIATLRSFCDRCIWLNHGEIVDSGDPAYISAQYMEFMYLDNSPALSGTEASASMPAKDGSGKPIAHWGSCPGLLHNISLTKDGQEISFCNPNDLITISFSIPYIPDIDYDFLSVSFSIKNNEGLDLIVSTLYETGMRIAPDPNGHTFRFALRPQLANGDYYLALGVEHRSGSDISYYEYLEGAKYFKVFRNGRHFGRFLPDIHIDVTPKGEEKNGQTEDSI